MRLKATARILSISGKLFVDEFAVVVRQHHFKVNICFQPNNRGAGSSLLHAKLPDPSTPQRAPSV